MRGISAELFESGTTPMTAKSELRTFPTLKTPAPSTGVLRELEMEMLRAVRAGDPQRVAKLLASGCKPHPQVSPTAGFLLESTRPEISLLLLESGADVNAVRHSDGDTPLMLAVRGGDAKMVHLLLEYGANPSVRNRRNESPLILAAQLNKHDIYSLLIGRPHYLASIQRTLAITISCIPIAAKISVASTSTSVYLYPFGRTS
ncbi:hypothetical protein FOL46_007532 [Perkinsus olseni]|uniref:Ankyrin Repeat Protein n=1 Tax=Perkinsus olseni TaxID=32597 RepID=A0A7J6LCZ3_PEROL|nr:hypothetical protein FOL46_007532 [Perkinsus olseni]